MHLDIFEPAELAHRQATRLLPRNLLRPVLSVKPRSPRHRSCLSSVVSPGDRLSVAKQNLPDVSSPRRLKITMAMVSAYFSNAIRSCNGIGIILLTFQGFQYSRRAEISSLDTGQGGRTLNSCNANDLREVVDIPTSHSAAHGDAFFILALLEQTNGEAF